MTAQQMTQDGRRKPDEAPEAHRDPLIRALKLLSRCSTLLIHAESETELLSSICKLAVETAGYSMAWVGFVGNDVRAPISLQAQFGGDSAELAKMMLALPGADVERRPSAAAIITGKTVVIHDYDTDPAVAEWRNTAARQGNRSSIACPLLRGQRAFGVLTIYASEPASFGEAEAALMEELARNLAFGIATVRTRAENERAKIALSHEQRQLAESEARYRELLENLQTAVVVHAPDTQIIFCNPRASELLGLSVDRMRGKTVLDPAWRFLDEQGARMAVKDYPVNRVLATLKPLQALVVGVKPPGSDEVTWVLVGAFPGFDSHGKLKQIVVSFDDITARKKAEDEVQHMAFFDLLTGLPNRRLLMDRLHAALAASARNRLYGALLFIDLDRFKAINDVGGHDAGDLLLVAVGERLRAFVRSEDTVARLGGDEFVVLLPELGAGAKDASQKGAIVAEKIRLALNARFDLGGHVHHTSPSIGISIFSGAAEAPEMLLRQADMAMYKAKDAGRNTMRFFSSAMQLAVETHASLEADLRHAVPYGQLRLHYQMQVDAEQRPCGAEALSRWLHPTRGAVSPLQFIPIAEESSLILDIGGWVLDSACAQLAKWAGSDQLHQLTLAVNVSAQQFRQPGFVETVAAALARHAFEPARLKLELTESVIVADVGDIVGKMHRLRSMGVSLSMDDFGTGYSSLSYLKQLPLNQIKIDQSFTRDISSDPTDANMVKTIIDLARNFRLDVIAEGVETMEQLAFLQRHGCMAYQGYLFGKPMPIDGFEALARDQIRPGAA
jgi:diguanylate cyclase (GGDEF)-like protein/PAS domain S-box-containing protein